MHPRCPTKGADYFACAIYEKKKKKKINLKRKVLAMEFFRIKLYFK